MQGVAERGDGAHGGDVPLHAGYAGGEVVDLGGGEGLAVVVGVSQGDEAS